MAKPIDELQATLPRDHYLDADRFAVECQAIFHQEWFCVGRSRALADKGDYALVDITGESILLVRGDDGALRAFNNVCRHRGAQLVDATDPAARNGRFTGGIRCPYHSWNYRLDGELHSTPHLNIDKSCLGLHSVPVEEWGGFAFVAISAPAASLAEGIAEIDSRLSRYPLSELKTGHQIDYSVAANWKVIVENYNECYHCAGVHPELCRIVPAFRQGGGRGWPGKTALRRNPVPIPSRLPARPTAGHLPVSMMRKSAATRAN